MNTTNVKVKTALMEVRSDAAAENIEAYVLSLQLYGRISVPSVALFGPHSMLVRNDRTRMTYYKVFYALNDYRQMALRSYQYFAHY